jgi:hypothetical protein
VWRYWVEVAFKCLLSVDRVPVSAVPLAAGRHRLLRPTVAAVAFAPLIAMASAALGPILTAFSYAGGVFLVVTAEAGGYPELGLLIAGIEADANAALSAGADMVVR